MPINPGDIVLVMSGDNKGAVGRAVRFYNFQYKASNEDREMGIWELFFDRAREVTDRATGKKNRGHKIGMPEKLLRKVVGGDVDVFSLRKSPGEAILKKDEK